jgi:methionine synthase II (cobalamin-independent)
MKDRITADIEIEDLIVSYPESVRFLTKRGIRCIRCGEPIWGTLRELLREDGIDHPDRLVEELNEFLEGLG